MFISSLWPTHFIVIIYQIWEGHSLFHPSLCSLLGEVFTSDSLLSKLLKKSQKSTWGGVGLGVRVGEEDWGVLRRQVGTGFPKRGSACESAPFPVNNNEAHSWEAQIPGESHQVLQTTDPSPT